LNNRFIRSLLQFSGYSLAMVIPKKLAAKLGWKAGDKIVVSLTKDNGTPGVILTKDVT